MKLETVIKYILCVSLCLPYVSGYGQVKPDEKKPEPDKKGAITEEIEVVRPYKPVLADAVKIRRSPDLENTKPFKPNLSYNILDKRLELNTDIRQLQAQQLADEKEVILKNNYAKLGIGSLNAGLGEVYINTGKDPALQAGFYLKHFNQKGDELAGQKMSHQQVGIFGRSIKDEVSLNGELNYDRFGTNFYGHNPDMPSINPDPGKQRYSTFGFKGEVLKNYKETESDFNYAAKADAYVLNSLDNKKESSFAIGGLFNQSWKQFNVGVNVSVDITSSKDSSLSVSNDIFRLNPYVKLQGKNYKLIVGLNFISEFGDAGRTNLLPAVTAEFPLAPNYATIFAGYTGDVLKTSLLDLSRENPYLNTNVPIINAVEKSNIYGGVKGNAGAGFGYKVSASYRTIAGMPLFVNNYPKIQKFDLRYDPGNTKVLGLEGEISVHTSETFTWTGKVIANTYNTSTEEEAWFKPGLQVISNARFSINKKLVLDGDVLIYGDSKALSYVTTPAFEERIVSVKSFVDLSAGAEYRVQDKVGIFLRANNILGTAYQKYLYYPKVGFNIFGGLNYSF